MTEKMPMNAIQPSKVRGVPSEDMKNARAIITMLSDHFGDQSAAEEFLREFAGLTLRMPAPDLAERLVRERRVQEVLRRDPSAGRVHCLADVFAVPRREVLKSFAKTNGAGVMARRAELVAVDAHDPDAADAGE